MNVVKKKYVMLFLKIIAVIIIILNTVWFINFYLYYSQIKGYEKSPENYIKSGRDYTYTVDPPGYMKFRGNYALTNNNELSIIVWPNAFMFGTPKYGICIYEQSEDVVYRFYVDSDLKYLGNEYTPYTDEEEIKIKKLLVRYTDELITMKELVYNEWEK